MVNIKYLSFNIFQANTEAPPTLERILSSTSASPQVSYQTETSAGKYQLYIFVMDSYIQHTALQILYSLKVNVKCNLENILSNGYQFHRSLEVPTEAAMSSVIYISVISKFSYLN